MAGAPSMLSFVENFHNSSSFSGSVPEATPVCSALPRKMGQSARHQFDTTRRKPRPTNTRRAMKVLHIAPVRRSFGLRNRANLMQNRTCHAANGDIAVGKQLTPYKFIA